MQGHPNVVPKGTSKKTVTATGIVVRYGFQNMTEDGQYQKCTEMVFLKMPTQEHLKRIIEEHNSLHGIHEEFNPNDYGYEQSE